MCVLLVEDEPLIRMMLVDELVNQGFDVIAAENGEHATTLIEQRSQHFSILLTDIHMPGKVDGIEVARRLRALRPEIPVVFTTGRPEALHEAANLRQKYVLVRKPYALSELLAVVRRHVPAGVNGR